MPVFIFAAGFALYLFSSAPALAPYRDMGEMVSVARTLGVAHPPGYPAYALAGKISQLLPLSNPSYRLNLVSIVGGALSAVFLYLLLLRLRVPLVLSAFTALIWLGSAGVWTVSVVTEMYSLHLAAGMALLCLAARLRDDPLAFKSYAAAAFLCGLSAGVRLDLVLLLPAFFVLAVLLLWKRGSGKNIPAVLGVSGLFFLLGFSIYLYLMLRSAQRPLLNWLRPDSLEKLLGSILRKSHGGTLDLLSASYAPGELFWTDFKVYLWDAARQFRWLGMPLALYGAFRLFKNDRAFFAFTAAGWFFAGPFFLYKANLPPNTHALSILEPHFLMPNFFVIVWAGLGLAALGEHFPMDSAVLKKAGAVFLTVLAGCNLFLRWGEVSKRGNYFAWDYGRNLLATLPPDSILVMQKDVQLFTFWALQYTLDRRPDVSVVARGLSGSPWYQKMRQENGFRTALGPLRSVEDFEEFLAANPGRGVYAGWDQDVPSSPKYGKTPRGLVRKIAPGGETRIPSVDFLRDIYVYRGLYRATEQKEFFSSDLIEDYGKGHFALGVELSKTAAEREAARREFDSVICLNPDSAAAYYRRAFTGFEAADYVRAERDFRRAETLYEKMHALALRFHSLPEVTDSVRTDWANALLNLGVTLERSGRREECEPLYLKAARIQPALANPYYNLAVLYWNRDWEKVDHYLRETLKRDPQNAAARAYWPKVQYALQKTRSAGGSRP